MKPKDLFRYGCTNLFRRKTRTALTALSMAVGVMCIVVLISVGLGYEQAYRESICLLYTSPSPRDLSTSRMPSSA